MSDASRLSILRRAPGADPASPGGTLVVNEVYASIQGESTYTGRPCAFVRLSACHMRCVWCDTAHAFDEGRRRTVDEVVAEVEGFGLGLVLVTGGEPLLQPAVHPLMSRLCDSGHRVLLETSGSLDIGGVDPRVVRIVDLKCPGSGEVERNRWTNLPLLRPSDEVKFVLADRVDYEWAREVVRRERLDERATVLLSVVHGLCDPAEVARWMIEDRLPARLQVQLHKVIWGADARGV